MKQDTILSCMDCKQEFTYSAGDREFMEKLYEEGKVQQLTVPKRCHGCREARKAWRASVAKGSK